MHAREHDHDGSREPRPGPARLGAPRGEAAARAAMAGRWDVAGAEGLLALQRLAGNQGVTAALDDSAVPEEEPSPVHDVIGSGGGQPLDPAVRVDMEARLGHDFGDVRVHHDARAEESARSVNAHAYTVGSDIVFQRDRYDPSSEAGRITLAHELTHVIQQRSGPVDGTAAPGGIRLSDPSDRFEREASANAERAMSTPSPAAASNAPDAAHAVQRAEDEQQEEEPTAQGTFVQRDEGESGSDQSPGGGQTVRFETDQGRQDLPPPQALTFLQDNIEISSNKIDLMAGENAELKKQRDDSILTSVIGSVADVMGGLLTMPDPSIWDTPKASIKAAKAAVAAGDARAAGEALKAANDAYQDCRKRYLTYKEGNFEGADNTIIGLKAVIIVDTAIATAATGGAASGVMTGALAAGGAGAGGAALADAADQLATGKSFDWAELAEQTAGGLASGFLGALISGPLKEMLSESCSEYVTEELMSEEDLADLAKSLGVEKLERDFLQSQLKRFIIDEVADKAGEWLMGKPIEMVTEEMKKSSAEGKAPPDEASAVLTVAKYAAPLIAAAFMAKLEPVPTLRRAGSE